jgi:hypothetical protein
MIISKMLFQCVWNMDIDSRLQAFHECLSEYLL